MKKKFLFRKREGAVLPLVALAMIVLLGFSAIAVDAGSMYLDRREMATAADAGALAGAKELSDSNGLNASAAVTVAKEVAIANGADPGTVTATITTVDGLPAVEVIAHKLRDTMFARVLGVNQTNVGARSVAAWGYLTKYTGGNMIPLFELDPGHTIIGPAVLKEGKMEVVVVENEDGTETATLNNDYGYLDIDNGMNIIKSMLADESYTIPQAVMDEILVDGILEGETGNKQSLIGSIETRMQKALNITASDEEAENRARSQYMTGIVPIIDYDEFLSLNVETNPQGKITGLKTPLDLPIIYFATFEILDIVVDNKGNGSSHALDIDTYDKVTTQQKYPGENKGTIIGKFVDDYVPVTGEISQNNPNPGGYSQKSIRLVDVDYIGD